ncbi:MAG: hypothetical protein ACT4QF_19950 [Sporichthyaceae bacterium]
MITLVTTPGGEWVQVGNRQDWVPTDQPPSPDGSPGLWHVVTDPDGSNRWKWHQRRPPPMPPGGLPMPPGPPPGQISQPVMSYLPPKVRRSIVPDWRTGTWVILAFNLLMMVWVIAGASSASGEDGDCQYLSADTCNAASDAGTAIGVALLIGLWVAGDVILGVVWLVTNRSRYRECPACGANVKRGKFVCNRCDHDFRSAALLP